MSKKIKLDLKDVPILKERRSQMSMNIADQQFIKRLLDLQNKVLSSHIEKVYAGHIKGVYRSLAEILAANTEKVFRLLAEQSAILVDIHKEVKEVRQDIREMKVDIKLINERLFKLEDRMDMAEAKIIVLENRLKSPSYDNP
jgi:hypothetical protein